MTDQLEQGRAGASGPQPPVVTTPDQREHLLGLDVLRGMAIIGVVVGHIAYYWGWVYRTGPLELPFLGVDVLRSLLSFSGYGLYLFFLLSGYLLAGTEQRRARSGSYSVRSYAMRRALRLVPAYYVAIVLVILLGPAQTSVVEVVAHASFLHGLIPATAFTLDGNWWSLTPEVVFYCLLPLIVLKLPRLPQRLALLGVCLVVAVATGTYVAVAGLHFVLPSGDPSPWLLTFPSTLLYVFVVGVVLRDVIARLDARPASRRRARLASVLCLLSLAAILVLPYVGAEPYFLAFQNGQDTDGLRPILADLGTAVAVIAFFTAALLGAPLLRPFLRSRVLAFVGLISYSLFLLHGTVLVISSGRVAAQASALGGEGLLTDWGGFLAFAIAMFAVSGVLAYLSYRFVESPFLRRKPR